MIKSKKGWHTEKVVKSSIKKKTPLLNNQPILTDEGY